MPLHVTVPLTVTAKEPEGAVEPAQKTAAMVPLLRATSAPLFVCSPEVLVLQLRLELDHVPVKLLVVAAAVFSGSQ